MEETLWITSDAARRIGIASAYLTRLCQSGKVPAVKVQHRDGQQTRERTSRRNGLVRYHVPHAFYFLKPQIVDAAVAFKASGGKFFGGAFLRFLERESIAR